MLNNLFKVCWKWKILTSFVTSDVLVSLLQRNVKKPKNSMGERGGGLGQRSDQAVLGLSCARKLLKYFVMLPIFRKVLNLVLFYSFFSLLFIKIMCITIKSSWHFEELNLLMKSKKSFLSFLIIINFLNFYNAHILRWGFHIKKMNLREH